MFQRVVLILLLLFVPVSFAGAFQVPDTGITECYDADGNQIFPCPGPGEPYYGQDGNLILNDMSFTDNGNGTLIDNVTGLLWQKTAGVTPMTWDAAADYCASLNSSGLGGHSSGWRLPALVELDSIMDLSVDSGAAINPIFPGTTAAGFWTSNEDPNDNTTAWIMDFGTTDNEVVAKTATNYARCVWTEVAQ